MYIRSTRDLPHPDSPPYSSGTRGRQLLVPGLLTGCEKRQRASDVAVLGNPVGPLLSLPLAPGERSGTEPPR
ncbi:hypothetical protein NDU88_000606 [Pleurodeles waltl]|uniref:Uncharacterized protein n=1 Tax=Pleurodeles waltl TaxID=8319 RepID=A0AAV7S6L3_PLEWA|nr:hypothetical protein NDU88_000606 [Pleurodeles waltl]